MPVKGTYLALAGGGAILLWSGIKGKKFTSVLRNVVSGQSPASAQTAALITQATGDQGGGGGGSVPIAGSILSMLTQLAGQKGWDSRQVKYWVSVIHMEASGPTSTNPQSGAFGWAQALGHGTAGTAGCGRNEYGGYGLTDAQAQKANCGSSPEQFLWQANYIQDTYGTPEAAYNFHLQNGYY